MRQRGPHRPFVLVQLSDPHVGADWGDGDSVARFAAAVESVRALKPTPDAVLISGDVADHALDAEYEQVRELLAPVRAPLYVLPGNHDDRLTLRRHFEVPGTDSEPVQYAADLGPLRLVVTDSTLEDEDRGELDASRLAWLQAALSAAPRTPTLVALHHAPVTTGVPAFDKIGLPPDNRMALGNVIGAHPQVRRIAGGHVHLTVCAELGGRPVLAAPSTYVQARLELGAEEIKLSGDPRGFAVHVLLDGQLFSHVQSVP
jgi:Icc protein